MKNHIALLTALVLLISLPAMAQLTGKVAGTARDAKGQPLESASITLLNAQDSTKLRVTATNKAGEFSFDHVPAGKYLVQASSVGFTAIYSPSFTISREGATR